MICVYELPIGFAGTSHHIIFVLFLGTELSALHQGQGLVATPCGIGCHISCSCAWIPKKKKTNMSIFIKILVWGRGPCLLNTATQASFAVQLLTSWMGFICTCADLHIRLAVQLGSYSEIISVAGHCQAWFDVILRKLCHSFHLKYIIWVTAFKHSVLWTRTFFIHNSRLP